jgi:hypothetical protein
MEVYDTEDAHMGFATAISLGYTNIRSSKFSEVEAPDSGGECDLQWSFPVVDDNAHIYLQLCAGLYGDFVPPLTVIYPPDKAYTFDRLRVSTLGIRICQMEAVEIRVSCQGVRSPAFSIPSFGYLRPARVVTWNDCKALLTQPEYGTTVRGDQIRCVDIVRYVDGKVDPSSKVAPVVLSRGYVKLLGDISLSLTTPKLLSASYSTNHYHTETNVELSTSFSKCTRLIEILPNDIFETTYSW